MFKEFDVVELTHDIKADNLRKGTRGTIVEIYKDSKAYEVEFIAPDGSTSVLLTLMPEDLRLYVNEGEDLFYGFNAPISLGTVSGTILDTIVNNDALRITTETFKSKADKEEFLYPIARL